MSDTQVPIQDQNTTTTSDGFIVGADPKAPQRTTSQFADQNDPNAPPVIFTETPASSAPPAGYFTQADIEAARKEEKDKLYGRLGDLEGNLKTLAQERDERLAQEQAARDAADADRKAKEEEAMDLRQLLERRDEEHRKTIDDLKSSIEVERAVAEKERQLAELENYRRDRIEQEAEYIMPELRDLISGGSVEAINSSIEMMKERTAAITQQMSDAAIQQRQQMRGVASTAPPLGPLEQEQSYESLSAADVANMDIETYSKYRGRLLQAASPYRR